jgi:hypothetical protein
VEEAERPMCGGVHKGVSDREACGMYVKGTMGEKNVEMLIDSGANISIVNYETYMDLNDSEKPSLKRYGIPMVTADGTPMKVYGCANFRFEIGDETCIYEYTLCIADIGVDVILGYDFLKDYDAIIDMGNSVLELKDSQGPENEGAAARKCNVIIGRNITVPAGGEAIAQGYCANESGAFVGMLETTSSFQRKHCMLVACAVVKVGPQGVPIRIFNAGDKPATVYKNTIAATCWEVEVMKPMEESGEKKGTEVMENLPEHLQQLFKDGCANLTDENQQRLRELLIEYQEVFSAHDLDMGKTGLI